MEVVGWEKRKKHREAYSVTTKTEVWDNDKGKAEGAGWTKEESIENAYKNWREKYK
jgi:hypothetical protein